MRARLKGIHSDEVTDLATWVPPRPDEFAVPLVLEVGPLGQRGRERFDLLVVTPAWLAARRGTRAIVPGRGKLLVFEWDWERLRSWLAKEVERCSGRAWPEVARKVARLAEWEGDGEGADIVGLE